MGTYCSRKYPYLSHGGFFALETPPPPLSSKNSNFSSFFCFKHFGFEALPLVISYHPPWRRCRFFLEPPINISGMFANKA